MSNQKDAKLRSLIREDPHFVIRSGTTIMAIITGVFLLCATQIKVTHYLTESLTIELETGQIQGESFILAHFPVRTPTTLEADQPCTVRLSGEFGSYQLQTTIYRLEQDRAIILLPQEIALANQENIPLNCRTQGLVEIQDGRITLFHKWFNALFSSF